MAIKGDFEKLRQLRERIAALAGSSFKRDLSRSLGEEAVKLAAEGARSRTAPDGRAWPEPRGGHALPHRGEDLAGSFTAAPTPSGFTLRSSHRAAPFLQHGTARMAPRKLVPEGTLPPRWRA